MEIPAPMLKPMTTRRRFLRRAAGVALGGGITSAAYGRWVEPTWLDLNEVYLPAAALPVSQPLTVVHLSDLHYSPVVPLGMIAGAVQLALTVKADLYALTGDFITGEVADIAAYAEVLSPLAKAAPVFACLGNHDGRYLARETRRPGPVVQVLARAGINLLHNRLESVRLASGQSLTVAGLGDLWNNECIPFHFMPSRARRTDSPGGDPILLLSHNPDTKDVLRSFDWDLMLCGHTHGGQICVPIINWAPRLPVDDKRFVAGLYHWEDRWLYITRGVGNLHGIRFACRPEVSVLRAG